MAVIEQANYWRHRANMVSVAVPFRRGKGGQRSMNIGRDICRAFGIGVLRIDDFIGVKEDLRPQFVRRTFTQLRDCLCDDHKDFAEAGSQGEFYTAFKGTVRAVKEHLAENPGASMQDVVKAVDHHYSSEVGARASLMKWVRNGTIRGIRVDDSVRPFRLYLDARDGAEREAG